MRKLIFAVAVVGALAVSGQSSVAQITGMPAPAADDDTVVCKKLPPPTGSHLPGPPVCHTNLQWKEMQAAGQNQVQELQHMGTMKNDPGS